MIFPNQTITPLKLTTTQIQAIQQQAEVAYPQECCGLLLGKVEQDWLTCLELWPTLNTWTPEQEQSLGTVTLTQGHSRGDRFWIDPGEILNAQRYGRDRALNIIGIYHSHPDHPAKPSAHDRQYAWPEYAYLILSVVQGKTVDYQSWQLQSQEFQPQEIAIV